MVTGPAKGGAMLDKKYNFVKVFLVLLLVVGLAFGACKSQEPAETEQPSTPSEQQVEPTAEGAATSFEAKTYTNDEYGFSVQYPADWVERPEILQSTIIAAFGVPGFVPGVSLSVRDADEPLTADWIVAANTAEGNTNVEVTSDLVKTTLADGTPAIQYTSSFKSGAYEIVSFATSVDKDGKRIRATVWTIDAFSPYDEAFFSEIAHTLSVK